MLNLTHLVVCTLVSSITGVLYGLSFGIIKKEKTHFISIGLAFTRLITLAVIFYLLQSYSPNLILVSIMFLITFWIIIFMKAHRYGST